MTNQLKVPDVGIKSTNQPHGKFNPNTLRRQRHPHRHQPPLLPMAKLTVHPWATHAPPKSPHRLPNPQDPTTQT